MELRLSPKAEIITFFDEESKIYSILIKDENVDIAIHLNDIQTKAIYYSLSSDSRIYKALYGHGESIFVKDPMISTDEKRNYFFGDDDKPTAEVEIYIPDAHVKLSDSEEITNACGEFMEALGYEMETEDEPIFHSFWKKLKFVFSKQVSPEEIDKLFNTGKRAIELRHVELPTAEQTEKLANASAKIVESLEKFEEGVVRLGSLLVLKKKIDGQPRIIIQQLNQELIKILDEKPQLLKSLQTVYELVTGDIKANKGVLDTPQEINVVQEPDELV